jgi:hypothetical protein
MSLPLSAVLRRPPLSHSYDQGLFCVSPKKVHTADTSDYAGGGVLHGPQRGGANAGTLSLVRRPPLLLAVVCHCSILPPLPSIPTDVAPLLVVNHRSIFRRHLEAAVAAIVSTI